MKIYTIIFNGKEEKWIRSDEEMSFGRAQEWMKEHNGTPATVSNLWEVDSDTKLPRWLLLKEAGATDWCWAGEDPEDACFAYSVILYNGFVDGYNRYIGDNFYALCRVC